MKTLDKNQILSANDLPTRVVSVPEWKDGGEVIVKTMIATEVDAYEASMIKGKGKNTRFDLENAKSKLCVRVLVDEHGNRLFGDNEAYALGRKSSKVIDRIYEVAKDLNGISDEDLEDLVGNSEAAQSGTFILDSPPTSDEQ